MRRAWLLVVLAGCFESHEVVCEDGRICPPDTTCLQLTASQHLLCGREDDLAACRGSAEFSPCALRDGVPGACYAETTGGLICQPSGCGNAITDPGEVCDDGNAVAGDRCSYLCRSNESCGNGFIDPVRLVNDQPTLNELCDDANALGRDGCASGCQPEAPRWQPVLYSSGPALSQHRMTFDPVRGRMVMFGGSPDNQNQRDEVWEWDGTAWSRVASTISPSARSGHALVYDLSLHQIITFGGTTGFQRTGDTWRWDGETWTALSPAAGPSPRSKFGTAYDTRRKRLVIFGGDDTSPADTWAWDGHVWTPLPTPPGLQQLRSSPVMGYDPVRDRVVLAGGDSTSVPLQDTWELDGNTWVQVADSTSTPSGLVDAAMAYDPVGRRMLVYGGGDTPSSDPLARTLAWDGQSWTDLGQVAPGPLRRAAIATDPVHRQIVMHGGLVTSCGTCVTSADTWLWDGTQWTQPPTPLAPGRRGRSVAAYDPDRGVVVMFSGIDDASPPALLGDTWELADGHWTRVSTTGPAPRIDAAMTYDAARRRMVLFGGKRLNGAQLPAETWTWDGAAWSLATPATSPPTRSGSAMAFDQARGRVVMFGGSGPTSDTWEWDGATWLARTPAQSPPARSRHLLAYDPIARHVLAVGGLAGNVVVAPASDTWAWDGTTWTQASSSGISARLGSAIAWNPARRRLTLFGGAPSPGTVTPNDDTWEWDGAAWRQVFTSDPPPGRQAHLAFPATDGSGIMVFGGDNGSLPGNAPATFDDLWRLTYTSVEPHEQCAVGIDLDGDGLAGCADPDCAWRCAPFCVATELDTAGCAAAGPRCGDGVCTSPRESCRLCPGDCGACAPACGDGFCDPGELCLGDCP